MLWSDGLGSIAAAAGRHIGAGAAIREAGLFMVRGRTVSLIQKKLTNNRVSNKISLERGPRGEWVKSFNLEPFPGPLSKDIVFQVTPIHIEALPYVDINLSLVSMLRTAMFAILQSDPAGFVIWMGILCATWSAMSRGSTRRCFLAPLGLDSLPCVSQANVMVSRCNT